MRDAFGTVDQSFSEQVAQDLDEACDRFEAAWKNAASPGEHPRIESYLGDLPQPERSALLRQLVLLDIDYRRMHADSPLPEDYSCRFPDLPAELLSDAFRVPPSCSPAAQSAPGP